MNSANRESIRLLEDEIADMELKLKESVRTKEVVQSSYDELEGTVEEQTEQHRITMAELHDAITDYKKKNADRTQQVINLASPTPETWTVLGQPPIPFNGSHTENFLCRLENWRRGMLNMVRNWLFAKESWSQPRRDSPGKKDPLQLKYKNLK